MKIVPMNLTHVDEVASLHIKADRETYAKNIPELLVNNSDFDSRQVIWATALRDPAVAAFIVYSDYEPIPVGFMSARILGRPASSAPVIALNSIYVLREFQSEGIGSALLSELLIWAIEARSDTIVGNVPVKSSSAREFFTGIGFSEHRFQSQGDAPNCFQVVEIKLTGLCSVLTFLGELQVRRSHIRVNSRRLRRPGP